MYTVGDIIWLVSSSYPGVKPYQVIEETTHKTLTGTLKTFYAKAPASNAQPIEIEKLEGEIFTSVELVQKELNLRASTAIDAMINKGHTLIEKYFTAQEIQIAAEETSNDLVLPETEAASNSDAEENFITLPDGTKARLNIKGNIL